MRILCFEILVRGRVQGVGFRPFIYRLAIKHGLRGEVKNRVDGVYVLIEGTETAVENFRSEILSHAPEAAEIKSVQVSRIRLNGYNDFRITSSMKKSGIITEISPDIAVCEDCLNDLRTQPHRLNYPLINCTQCGPRFTIIKGLPYDRARTTMDRFEMCSTCSYEYHDMNDRRFHAQPLSCNHCGPSYSFLVDTGIIVNIGEIITRAAEMIDKGGILAIKGTGGYHLVCDAFNAGSVHLLREKKQRDKKPFAVLFRDINTVSEYCHVNQSEIQVLTSWRRSVVLLKQKKSLTPSVNEGLETIGAILPYMPFHFLLFEKLITQAIVLTSGNISEEPLIADDDEAKIKFRNIAAGVVSYNRKIFNRADDSVVRVINEKVSIIRRSRGYVPSPVELRGNTEGILATGADLKNCFALGKENKAILSQHIGDLTDEMTYQFFLESIRKLSGIYRFTPEVIACDLHPGYISSRYARSLVRDAGISLQEIQHHHAHIASAMSEHFLDEKITGICLDGTGYGSDGNIWGGEFLVADPITFERYAHFESVPMPGGEMAVREPWRMALAYLDHYFGSGINYPDLPCFRKVSTEKKELVFQMISKNINSPLTSSAGRLFDAVSALTGICHERAYESEGPMRLESILNEGIEDEYPYAVKKGGIISFEDTFSSILRDLLKSTDISVISGKFHNTIARVICDIPVLIRDEYGINKVVLSGGVFQNKYLLERSLMLLKEKRFIVFTNSQVSVNDSGIALGQLFITSKTRLLCV